MIEAKAKEAEQAEAIAAVEGQLVAAGMKLRMAGKSGEFARVELGERGMTAAGILPLVLRIAPGVKARSAWESSVERSMLAELMGRIGEGWTETDGDAVQYFLGVELGGLGEAANAWHVANSGLAAWSAVSATGATLAELKVSASAVAPSIVKGAQWTRSAGSAGQLTVLTISELLGIGAALDEASAARDSRSKLAYESRTSGARTNAARDSVNRQTPAVRVFKALTKAGWTELDATDTLAIQFAAPGNPTVPVILAGGPLLPRGGVLVLDDVELPKRFIAGKSFRPFEVLAILEHRGDTDAAAEALLASGEARIETEIFQAAAIVDVDIDQRSMTVVSEVVKAITRARSRHDSTIPLAVQQAIPGSNEPRKLLSVTPSGGMKTWKSTDGLISAAVQLVKMKTTADPATGEKGIRDFIHATPPGIRDRVSESLTEPGRLPEAEYIGQEPMITAKGEVISEHGYHPAERMLLAIPENQRAMWAKIKVDNPTKAEAQAALDWLRAELLPDFPFETPGDEARALSLLLTAVARPITQQSPFYIANGSEVGTGKSLLLAIIRYIASGNTGAAVWKGGKFDDEDVKSLVAAVRESLSRVWMHNDEAGQAVGRDGRLESAMVTRFTTGLDGEGKERVLGGNDNEAINGVLFTAAGNGILPGGDLPRRTLICTMLVEGGVLAVERKGFHHADLLGFVKEHRADILQRVFTILAHGIQNQVDVPSYGFSGAWPRVILGAMDHLTMGSANAHQLVMDAMKAQMATDKQSDDWSPLIAGLSEITVGTPFEARSARLWAEVHHLEAPDRLRFDRAKNEVGMNRSWSVALKQMVGKKVNDGEFRYRMQLEKTTGKAAKRFIIERFAATGEVAPERGKPQAVPVITDDWIL